MNDQLRINPGSLEHSANRIGEQGDAALRDGERLTDKTTGSRHHGPLGEAVNVVEKRVLHLASKVVPGAMHRLSSDIARELRKQAAAVNKTEATATNEFGALATRPHHVPVALPSTVTGGVRRTTLPIRPPRPPGPHLSAADLTGRTAQDIRDLAHARGLEPYGDPDANGLFRKFRDPKTEQHPKSRCRLRIDAGHFDKETGLPYDNPNAAAPMSMGTTSMVHLSWSRDGARLVTNTSRSHEVMAVIDQREPMLDRDVRLWMMEGGGITIKAVTPEGDPVELSSTQARQLAERLIELADEDDD